MAQLQAPALVRFVSLRPSRWRNGGGSTTEMVISGNDGDTFDWRLSLAEIEQPGTFSPFPGTARTLTVVHGQRLTLMVDGKEHQLERHRPFSFSGDASTDAVLPLGPVRALNVITRHGAVRAHFTVLELIDGLVHRLSANQLAVVLSGHALVKDGEATAELLAYDTVRGDRQEGLDVEGLGFLALVSIEKLT
jgi:uncharacterized protein